MLHNHFLVCQRWLISNWMIRVREQKLKSFNNGVTIAILVCKKISSNPFKNKITYKSYLNVCKQMTDVKSNCYCYIAMLKAILLSSSSSSCRAVSTDIPDSLPPPPLLVHCFRQVFRATSRIGTELLYVVSSWSSCLFTSMWRGPQEYITYELVPTSPACLVHLILIVFVMGGGWPYSCCFVRCYLQD